LIENITKTFVAKKIVYFIFDKRFSYLKMTRVKFRLQKAEVKLENDVNCNVGVERGLRF